MKIQTFRFWKAANWKLTIENSHDFKNGTYRKWGAAYIQFCKLYIIVTFN
jgi:hypothetical protein